LIAKNSGHVGISGYCDKQECFSQKLNLQKILTVFYFRCVIEIMLICFMPFLTGDLWQYFLKVALTSVYLQFFYCTICYVCA